MDTTFFHQVRACYRENRQGLFTYALTLTGNRAAAEDAAHSAICGLLGRRRMPDEVRPYLFRAVRNAAVDHWRRDQARVDPIFQDSAAAQSPEQSLGLEQCLNRLGDDERETIVLKIYQGMTFSEIGEVRGQPANTAASHYRRGLQKMKVMLEEDV